VRTDQEILDRMKAVEERDFLGFETADLIDHLGYEAAKPYLKPEVTKEQWEEIIEAPPAEQIAKYMPFAWEKANNARGLSAARSICHMSAWLWLDGKDEMAEAIRNYGDYGKPQLRLICAVYSLDYRQWDDEV
jgi:hypothetical protein